MTTLTQSEADVLTEAHRLAQARVGAETVQMMLSNWAQLDLSAVQATLTRWVESSERIIVAQYVRSANLAAQYGGLRERLELGPNATGSDLISAADVITLEEMRPSLLVTGPGRLFETLRKGNTLEVAGEKAQVAAARSAQRLALSGGRKTLLRTGVGYRRVTSGKPCAFCAMLASRGAVYHDHESAGFQAHDGCNCHPEPVYRRGETPPPQTQEWKDVYSEAQAERRAGEIKAGGDNPALNALRTHMRRTGLL